MPNPLIVAVGASAGGVEVLSELLRDFPTGGNAAFFVTLHVSRLSTSMLPQILGRVSGLPSVVPRTETAIRPGYIYVAPPDFHLIVGKIAVRLDHGPRENLQRPAIDPMFRSAAAAHGANVVGLVCTGSLDDGAAGLQEIKRCGGVAMVQDPAGAQYPSMPWAAIGQARPHLCGSTAEIRTILWELSASSQRVKLLATLRRKRCALNFPQPRSLPHPRMSLIEERNGCEGPPSGFICPECHGPLWEVKKNGQFICRVGHTFSGKSLLEAHGDDLERALWTAVRTLEERASLQLRLATQVARESVGRLRNDFMARAKESRRSALLIRRAIGHRAK